MRQVAGDPPERNPTDPVGRNRSSPEHPTQDTERSAFSSEIWKAVDRAIESRPLEEMLHVSSSMKPLPDTPWDCHICRPIDPSGTTPGLIGSPMAIPGSWLPRPLARPQFGGAILDHVEQVTRAPTVPRKSHRCGGSESRRTSFSALHGPTRAKGIAFSDW